MFYVYRIQSENYPNRSYIGFSADLKRRLNTHNAGKNRYTAPFRPWTLVFYAAFTTEEKAREFESYLKTGSGAAFGNKRLWQVRSSFHSELRVAGHQMEIQQ